MKLKIQTKLLLSILSTSLAIYLLAFGYLSYTGYKTSVNEAQKLTDTYAQNYANSIMIKLNSDMAAARTLVQTFSEYRTFFATDKQDIYSQMIKDVLENNTHFISSTLNFELSEIDPKYDKDHGRISIIHTKENGIIKTKIDSAELQGNRVTEPYYLMKINPREEYSEPTLFSPSESKIDKSLISSLSVPIKENNTFVGLLKFDVNLDRFQSLIHEIKVTEDSYGFLLSNKGVFVASPDKKLINKPVEKVMPEENLEENIILNIKSGNHFSYIKEDNNGKSFYISYYPIKFGESPVYWSLGVVVPYDQMILNATYTFILSTTIGLIGFTILIAIIWLISRSISTPLRKTANTIKKIAIGNISSDLLLDSNNNDEINDINKSVNNLINGLENNLKFALQIGKGNLEFDYKLSSKNDALGKALLDMRLSLKQASEDEANRKNKDMKLNWATKGFAQFGEFMRENTDKLSEFSYNIISNLVKYLNASQGGLFIINDNEKDNIYIELSASYAYNRRKYFEKNIKLGVGLVGRCINEKETIFMTEFPEDYLNITSGLGEAKPRCLLLVPILFNQQVFGVIEMASFTIMEQYQIEFVERIGESIGSTISNVKMNEQTAKLLEESKIQSEELVAQEEEMRQNLEEMKATQEELEHKAMDHNGIINALHRVALIAEFDMQGRLIDINKDFLRLLNKSKDEMLGTFQGAFSITKEDKRNLFRDFWNDLRRGLIKKTIQHININGKDIYLSEAYTPIYDNDNSAYKVLNISIDITESIMNKPE